MSSSAEHGSTCDDQIQESIYPSRRLNSKNKACVSETAVSNTTTQELLSAPLSVEKSSREPNESSSGTDNELYTGLWSTDELDDETGLNEFQKKMLEEHRQATAKINRGCVIMERNRRKRITVSCNKLRQLLPQLSGSRNDMVTILEMTVAYLELIQQLLPAHQHRTVLYPPEELCKKWQLEHQIKRQQCRRRICEEVSRQKSQRIKSNRSGKGKPCPNPGLMNQSKKAGSLKTSDKSDHEVLHNAGTEGMVDLNRLLEVTSESHKMPEAQMGDLQYGYCNRPQQVTTPMVPSWENASFFVDYRNEAPQPCFSTSVPVTSHLPDPESSFSWSGLSTPVGQQAAQSLCDLLSTPQLNYRLQPHFPQEKTLTAPTCPSGVQHTGLQDWEELLEGDPLAFSGSISFQPSATHPGAGGGGPHDAGYSLTEMHSVPVSLLNQVASEGNASQHQEADRPVEQSDLSDIDEMFFF
ncbi:uncharacterized protein [Lepisosteus oculatus]|uniref:uncharacterized protein n=1 Tax=Lepisosteus oculatus TaxID=7918 RepID=UPI000740332E|nr:PREDICTED: spermatogenesis- and oogenesis-specific basic helix-loop-helix-containing protein 1 [Lepisosteus oculatus]